MNDILNIETPIGYVANDNPLRASRSGKSFEEMIPAPAWTEVITKRNGSVTETVNEMRKIINKYHWQAGQVAPLLKGRTLEETCQNIWNFLFYHIRYNEDSPNKEELRTFSRTFADRKIGVDCDDFSISCGCILSELNIPFYIRIARYKGKDYFQHVYVIVPKGEQDYITIDGVLDQYDAEKPPVETKDFIVMNNKNLNGVDISVLGGVDDELLNEISGVLNGIDFQGLEEMEGLGNPIGEEELLGAIRNYMVRTRNLVARRPQIVADTQHPQMFLGMLDYALKYWDTDKREEALGVLENEENRINDLEGLGGILESHESVDLFYGLTNNGTYDLLGKAKAPKKFFTKVKQATQVAKQATKKAGQKVVQKTKQVSQKAASAVKKVTKAVVRYNPVSVTLRASVLLALKVNLLQSASKLKWGYLTEAEARQHGFDMNEWRKVKAQLAKAENMFVNELQGKAENFKNAILTGRAGGLSGEDLGLGVVVATAAAASTAAATPFITKILRLLKDINFGKLVSNVKALNLKRKQKKADKEVETPEGGSAMPEGGQASDNPPSSEAIPSEQSLPKEENTSSSSESSNSQSTESSGGQSEPTNNDITTTSDGDKTTITANRGSGSGENNSGEEGTDSSNTDNLPSNSARGAAPATTDTETKVNFITKAMDWVKENPTTSVLIGAGAAFLIYEMVKPSDRSTNGLSGVRRGKRKKKKGKKHPPRVVTGVNKKRNRNKRKGGKPIKRHRGGNGQTKRIKL